MVPKDIVRAAGLGGYTNYGDETREKTCLLDRRGEASGLMLDEDTMLNNDDPLFDAKIVTKEKTYSFKNLKQCVHKLRESQDAIDPFDFSEMLDELCKLLSQMGKTMALAFSDIHSKSSIIADNKSHFVNMLSEPEDISLQ